LKKRIIIYLFVSLLVVVGAYFYSQKTSSNNIPQKLFSFEMYYVPVTNYWTAKSNISLEDLKNRESLVVEEGDKESIAKLLGIEKQEMITEKTVEEIQKGLKEGEVAIIKWSEATPNLKTMSYEGKYLWKKADIIDYKLKTTIETDDPKILSQKINPEKLTKLTATGDVILGRTVAKKMAELGFFHPWEKISTRISDADITFSDLEVPLSDLVPIPYIGMNFVAPKAAITGLVKSGIDIVALANNHSTNFGTKVFTDTLNLLKENNILYVGGGKNLEEAEKEVIIEKNGQKWAFLNWNSIIGAIPAKDNTPGIAEYQSKPWAKSDSEEDFVRIENKIKEVKKNTDIVVVEFHWGVEYVTEPIESQKILARRAIDAGADLVVGTHPHAVQGSEIYKGKYITYSLGNFIFDQEWSQGTKEGTVLESYFYGTKNVASNLAPVLIEDYNQPRFLTDNEGRSIIERIKSVSVGF
jgi:poly-gamma-glutamate capsule biosynthesis protein CapA/YwtB (metallophosphatase superfamily)